MRHTQFTAVAILFATLTSSVHAQFTLTVLHNNDGESSVLPVFDPVGGESFGEVSDAGRFVSLVNQQKAASTNPIMLSSGDNFLAGPNFNASFANDTFYDALLLDQIGYDALAIGNHEFDFGEDVFADFINTTTGSYPFLSSNLDFSNSTTLQPLVDTGRIAKSTVINVGGDQVGVIGATTTGLASVSSPGSVIVGQDVVGSIQGEVTALQGAGVNKIVLVSHLQSLSNELDLIGQLSNVDIVIAGGGDELLDGGTPLLPADTANLPASNPYPIVTTSDSMGVTVPVVTTPGRYDYLGKLVVEFDANGVLTAIDDGNSGLLRVAAADGLVPDANTVATIQDPVTAFLGTATEIGGTEVDLVFRRTNVRGEMTNFGALTTDAYLAKGKAEAAGLGVTDPVIAIQNGGGIRDDNTPSPFFASQELLDLDIRNALPFDNDVVLVKGFSTSRLLMLLEEAYDSLPDASGGFAQVGGFTVTIDPSQPEDSRVVDVEVEGIGLVIDDGTVVNEMDFALVTNSFSWSQNGDGYPLMDLMAETLVDGDGGEPGYAQVVIDYIQNELGGTVPANLYSSEAVAGRISVVPEPSALALMLMGALMLFRRRK